MYLFNATLYNETVFDVDAIINTGGILTVALIIFAESGLLIGIILPGDSLLLAAGVIAGHGNHLPIEWLVPAVVIAAIIGAEVGYWFGKRLGPSMFKRKDGFLFREEYISKTEKYFDKYGPITVVLARFVAHVRTLVTIIAGASNMERKRYFVYNVIGAVLWGAGLTLLGYFLGSRVPNVDRYIIISVVVTLVILYSLTLYHLTKSAERRRNLVVGLKQDWHYFFGSKRTKTKE